MSVRACSFRGLLLAAALTAAAVLASGCAEGLVVVRDGLVTTGYTSYQFDPPRESGWRSLSVKDSNVAFVHEPSASVITINSTCKEYHDASPEVLTRHLLMGVEQRTIHSQKKIPLVEREALVTDVSGSLDGVMNHLLIVVVNRDYCTYDLILVAPPEHFASVAPRFMKLVSSFRIATGA